MPMVAHVGSWGGSGEPEREESARQLGEPLCLHLISSGLGCDARSGLRLRACLRAQLQPLLVVLEACFTPEPLGPDGHSAAGLRKSPTLCGRGQIACLVPLALCREEAWGRAQPGCFGGATGLEECSRRWKCQARGLRQAFPALEHTSTFLIRMDRQRPWETVTSK